MNRRDLFKTLLAGAAAFVLEPKIAAARPDWLEPHIIEDWSPGIGVVYGASPGVDTWSAPGYVLPSGCTGCDICTIPTFEAMQADCAAHGGLLTREALLDPVEWFVTHKTDVSRRGSVSAYISVERARVHIDVFRQGLHEASD